MGTNYYVVKNGPTIEEPIHIGKSSLGWMFLFQEQHETWRETPVEWTTYEEVKEWLQKYTVDSNEYVIINEYDEVVSFDDFCNMVDYKQRDITCRSNKENFYYHIKNVNGYRFTDTDFS